MLLFELFENDNDHREHLEATGFWGRRGAGCLFLAASTGRLLFSFRSGEVLEPHTYGTWGGAIDADETPEAAVRREAMEETFQSIPLLDMIPLYVFRIPNVFEYHNFLVVVEDEFHPDIHNPNNWETEGYKWVPYGKWPTPLHPGAIKLLNNGPSVRTIRQTILKYCPDAL